MQVTRTSQYSKVERTLDLDITQEQLDRYQRGVNVQTAFPNLTRAECEFILTGIIQEEWDSMFPADSEVGF